MYKPWEMEQDLADQAKEREQAQEQPKTTSIFEDMGNWWGANKANYNANDAGVQWNEDAQQLANNNYSNDEEQRNLLAKEQNDYWEQRIAQDEYNTKHKALDTAPWILQHTDQFGGTMQGMRDWGIGAAAGAALGGLAGGVLGMGAGAIPGAMTGAKIGGAFGGAYGGWQDNQSNAIEARQRVLDGHGTPAQAEAAYQQALIEGLPLVAVDTFGSAYMGAKGIGGFGRMFAKEAAENAAKRGIFSTLENSMIGRGISKLSNLDIPERLGESIAYRTGMPLAGRAVTAASALGLEGLGEGAQEVGQNFVTDRAVNDQAKYYNPAAYDPNVSNPATYNWFSPENKETFVDAAMMAMLPGAVSHGLNFKGPLQHANMGDAQTIQYGKDIASSISDGSIKVNEERLQEAKDYISRVAQDIGYNTDEIQKMDAERLGRFYVDMYGGNSLGYGNTKDNRLIAMNDYINMISDGHDTVGPQYVSEASKNFFKKHDYNIGDTSKDTNVLIDAAERQAAEQGTTQQATGPVKDTKQNTSKTDNTSTTEATQQAANTGVKETSLNSNTGEAASEGPAIVAKGKVFQNATEKVGSWRKTVDETSDETYANPTANYIHEENGKTARIEYDSDSKTYDVYGSDESRPIASFTSQPEAEKYLSAHSNDENFSEQGQNQQETPDNVTKETDGDVANNDTLTEPELKPNQNNPNPTAVHGIKDLNKFYDTMKKKFGARSPMDPHMFMMVARALMRNRDHDITINMDLDNERTGQTGNRIYGAFNRSSYIDPETGTVHAILSLYKGADAVTALHEMGHVGWMGLSEIDRNTFSKYARGTEAQYVLRWLGMEYNDENVQKLMHPDSEMQEKIDSNGIIRQTIQMLTSTDLDEINQCVEERFAHEFSTWYMEGYLHGQQPANIIQRILNRVCASLNAELELLGFTAEYLHSDGWQKIKVDGKEQTLPKSAMTMFENYNRQVPSAKVAPTVETQAKEEQATEAPAAPQPVPQPAPQPTTSKTSQVAEPPKGVIPLDNSFITPSPAPKPAPKPAMPAYPTTQNGWKELLYGQMKAAAESGKSVTAVKGLALDIINKDNSIPENKKAAIRDKIEKASLKATKQLEGELKTKKEPKAEPKPTPKPEPKETKTVETPTPPAPEAPAATAPEVKEEPKVIQAEPAKTEPKPTEVITQTPAGKPAQEAPKSSSEQVSTGKPQKFIGLFRKNEKTDKYPNGQVIRKEGTATSREEFIANTEKEENAKVIGETSVADGSSYDTLTKEIAKLSPTELWDRALKAQDNSIEDSIIQARQRELSQKNGIKWTSQGPMKDGKPFKEKKKKKTTATANPTEQAPGGNKGVVPINKSYETQDFVVDMLDENGKLIHNVISNCQSVTDVKNTVLNSIGNSKIKYNPDSLMSAADYNKLADSTKARIQEQSEKMALSSGANAIYEDFVKKLPRKSKQELRQKYLDDLTKKTENREDVEAARVLWNKMHPKMALNASEQQEVTNTKYDEATVQKIVDTYNSKKTQTAKIAYKNSKPFKNEKGKNFANYKEALARIEKAEHPGTPDNKVEKEVRGMSLKGIKDDKLVPDSMDPITRKTIDDELKTGETKRLKANSKMTVAGLKKAIKETGKSIKENIEAANNDKNEYDDIKKNNPDKLSKQDKADALDDLKEQSETDIGEAYRQTKIQEELQAELDNRNKSGEAYSYAGENSKAADHEQLAIAKDLELKKTSPLEIFKQTGWFRGADDQWRYYIPEKWDGVDFSWYDENKKINVRPLYKVYDNPELFKAYPFLKKWTVEIIHDGEDGTYGYANRGANTITINADMAILNKKSYQLNYIGDEKINSLAQSTLFHEIQHAIQFKEGFAEGTNQDEIDTMSFNRLSDKVTRLVQTLDDSELDTKNINGLIDAIRLKEAFNSLGSTYEETGFDAFVKDVKKGVLFAQDDGLGPIMRPEDAKSAERGLNLLKHFSDKDLQKINDFIDKNNTLIKYTLLDPDIQYSNTLGEIEARANEEITVTSTKNKSLDKIITKGLTKIEKVSNKMADKSSILRDIKSYEMSYAKFRDKFNKEDNSSKIPKSELKAYLKDYSTLSQKKAEISQKYGDYSHYVIGILDDIIKAKYNEQPNILPFTVLQNSLSDVKSSAIVRGPGLYGFSVQDEDTGKRSIVSARKHPGEFSESFSEQGKNDTTVGDERKLYEADHDKNLKSVTFTDKALNSSANRKKVEEYRRQRSTWKENKNPDGSVSFTRLHPQKHQDQKVVYNKINGRDVRSEPEKFRDQLQHLITERAVRILFNDKEDLAQLARDSGVWDAYVKMMVLKDQGTAASSAILKGIVRKDGTRTMSLQQIVDNIGEDRQNDFLDYCIAYRVLDLANREKAVFEKMTVEEAKKIIADVKKSKDADLFETNRKGFVDYNLELLHKLVDGGIITEKDYQTMKEVDPNFVPLNKKFDEDDADFIAVHKSLINAKKPFRKIKGGDHEVKNPIMEMEKRTLDYYSRAARNEAGAVFVKEIAKAVNVDETGKMVKMHGGVIRELNPHYDKRGIPTLKPDTKDMIFTVYDNGKKRFFQCADRDIYNALQSFNGNQIKGWLKYATLPKKFLQWSATIVPDFGLRNFIRDNGEAFITSEHGFLPVVDSLWGVWQIMHDTDWFREYQSMNGELLTLNRLDDDIVGVSHNTGLREWYRMATNKNNSMKVRTQALLKVLGSPLMTLYTKNKRFNDYIELGTRIAEYKNARMGYEGIMDRVEKGDAGFGVKSLKTADVKNDEYYAAYMAKEITLNFGQHGTFGKKLGPYVPFLNAALQGSYKTLRMFKEAATDTQGNRLTISLKMAMVAIGAMAAASAGHGHKDYDEAPDWEKRSFWIFPNGFRIPKDQVFGRVIGNTVEAMANAYLSNKDPKYGKLIRDAVGEFIPDSFGCPQALTLLLGTAWNIDSFRRKPIVPVYMEDKLGYKQFDISTSNLAKDMSKFLYEFSHGNVDFSAKKIDYGFQQTLSNLGKYITTVYDIGKSAAGFKISEKMDRGGELGILRDNKAFPANQITGTFVTNNSNYQSINDFYERYKELKKLSTGPADGYDKKEWERYEEAYKQDAKLRKALKDIKESTNLSGAEKRAKADPIFEKQIKLAKWASGVK